ncbi:MAG: hypothetical protein ABSA93_17310 [Streptosporangiaceae bacterium]|jgi:DNA-binding SARP family transcriptional activator
MMELGLLGPLLVQRDGTPIAVTAPKQRAVLATLLLQAGVVVHAERLIDIVWQGRRRVRRGHRCTPTC